MLRTLFIFLVLVLVIGLGTVGLLAYHFSKTVHPVTLVTIPTLPSPTKGSIRLDAQLPGHTFALAPSLINKPIPTNTWWVSALTGPFPETLFSLPLATAISNNGIQTGIPSVVTSANTISTPLRPDLELKFNNSPASTQVSAYDDDSVTLDLLDKTGQRLASLRLVHGLPFQYFNLYQSITLHLNGDPASISTLSDGRTVARFNVPDVNQEYALYFSDGLKLNSDLHSITLNPSGTEKMVLAGLPKLPTNSIRQHFDSRSSTEIGIAEASFASQDLSSTTTLNWHTGNTPTLVLLLPHQQTAQNLALPRFGEYSTLRGTAYLIEASTLTVNYVGTEILDNLPLPSQDNFYNPATEEAYLTAEAANLKPLSNGSYTGAKELWRLANLYDIARQAGSPTASAFEKSLRDNLVNWLTYTPGESGNYFYYDSQVKGLVAASPEFDSQNFNDHHFHYGYFLYAAAILGRQDPTFVQDYRSVLNLIADDIAGTDRSSTTFPYLRVVDAYEGHSWAGGIAKFGDGNNQESVSEAINAWYGVLEWAKVSHNDSLASTARALYNQEVGASLTYYFQAGAQTALFPGGYNHSTVSLLWGGKADFSTWFSDKPEAKHGILYLPLSGGSLYLNTGSLLSDQQTALTKELAGSPLSNWQDVLLMANALHDSKATQAVFKPTMALDSSNSLPYLYAWLGWAGQR